MSSGIGSGVGTPFSELGDAGSLLNQLLAGRSTEFQARVYQLVIHYQWDVNDPSFAILIATGQMELLLDQFPEQFETLFEGLLQQLKAQSQGLQDWFGVEKGDLKELIRGLEVQQSQESELAKGRIEEFSGFIESQRTWTKESVESILAVAKQEREQIFEEVKNKLYEERAYLLRQVQSETDSWLEKASESWKLASIRNLVMGTGAAAAVVLGFGMVLGMGMYRGVINSFTEVPEAVQLLEWNRSQLRECRKVERTTCNVHIVDPEQK